MSNGETLTQALDRVDRERWSRMRSGKTLYSQAHTAVQVLMSVVGDCEVSAVTQATVSMVTAKWYALGLAPATIQKRLNCLRVLGVGVGPVKAGPKPLKWWLRPEAEAVLVRDFGPTSEFALFVKWTTRTGLRVEETLRLMRGDFSHDFRELTVPGTKTGDAQAAIALSSEAASIARELFFEDPRSQWQAGDAPSRTPMFRMDYLTLRTLWERARHRYGWQDIPTATLKALRRSAARHLHVDCGMPLDIVRQYLRHSDVQTTMGYLRLTGGYSTQEMRRYLP